MLFLTHTSSFYHCVNITTYTLKLDKIKDIVCKAPVLTAYDDKIVPMVQTDLPNNGALCELLQNNKPFKFCSRS